MINQTAIQIVIGIMTSFITGIFLIWRGEHAVHFLLRLPTKWRVAIYSRAYLSALRSYPYRYLNVLVMSLLITIVFGMLLAYIFITFIVFTADFSLPPDALRESIRLSFPPATSLLKIILNPWFLLSATLILVYMLRYIIYIALQETLVPYTHRELIRVRECVAKCGTNQQFIEYTDAEHSAKTLKDLRELIIRAQTIIGSVNLKLADEILARISTDLPKRTNDTE